MQSYRTDSTGKIIGFRGSEIGLIVWILCDKLWSKIQFNGQLRSQKWWKNRLQNIIDSPPIIIKNNLKPGIYDENGVEILPPIPFEIECGIPDLNWEMLIKLKPLHIEGLKIGEA
jgi:hypothetical protein